MYKSVDGDGTTDIIFTTCDGRKCMVHILYNQQIGLCSKTDGENLTHCRKSQHLCVSDPDFKFDIQKPNSEVIF